MFKNVNNARAQSVKADLFEEDKIFASYDSKWRVWNFVVLKTPVLVEIDFNFEVLALKGSLGSSIQVVARVQVLLPVSNQSECEKVLKICIRSDVKQSSKKDSG